MKALYDKNLLFIRFIDFGESAIIDLQSTLIRPISMSTVSLVVARDIRYLTAVRESAILSFVGELKPEWIRYITIRAVAITNEEHTYLNSGNRYSTAHSKFSNQIAMQLNNSEFPIKWYCRHCAQR